MLEEEVEEEEEELYCLEDLFDESECSTTDTSHLLINHYKPTDEITIKRIYFLGRIISRIFDDHNLSYWVTGGTLLGCVRHKGLIPWDDDLDICVENEDQFLSLKRAFEEKGVEISESCCGYRLHHKLESESCYNYGFPFCDIILMRENRKKKRMELTNTHMHGLWDKEWYTCTDVEPLQKMLYGDFYFKAPNNPLPYLIQTYGNDCLEVGMTHNYDHKTRMYIQSEKVNVSGGFLPAKPFK